MSTGLSKRERMTQWDIASTLNWKVAGSTPTDELSRTMGPNLLTILIPQLKLALSNITQ